MVVWLDEKTLEIHVVNIHDLEESIIVIPY